MLRWPALISASLAFVATNAGGQAYPNRPVRMVVPFPAGGTADVIARSVTIELERQFGQPFIIDNRGGANSIIGSEIVAKAASDGYTLLHVTAAFAINPSVYRKLPYQVEDFLPVTNLALGEGYLLLVHPAVPAQSVTELIALAKSKSGQLTYGSPGVGNTLHLAVEYFNMKSGIALTHVPYKGVAPAFTALMAGEVQVMLIPPVISLQHVKAGKVRALAFTGKTRWAVLPALPTVAETAIPGFYIIGGWHGWFAPAKTPSRVADRIHAGVYKALQIQKVREYMAEGGYEADGRGPAEFRKLVQEDVRRFADIVRATKIQPQ
jgi:tripartite-type tricarboxylate transporter receptor subunit TctC